MNVPEKGCNSNCRDLLNLVEGNINQPIMNKEEFLALAGSRYDALQKLNQQPSFYDYEKLFSKLWQELGRDVLEKNLGAVPTNRRKKNLSYP